MQDHEQNREPLFAVGVVRVGGTCFPRRRCGGRCSVQYYTGNSPSTNSQSTLAAGSGAATYDLTSVPLVLTSPATVNVGGTVYNFAGGGLYRIYSGSTLVGQTLLYTGDYWGFAEQLSRVHLHASDDDGDSTTQLDSLARGGNMLLLTCGPISAYASSHLQAVGVQTRIVSTLTLDPSNGYDDGHTLMEIRDPVENRWVLYDPEIGTCLRNGGNRLNLLDATTLYRSGSQAEIEILNSDSLYDPNETYTDPTAAYLKLNHDEAAMQTSYDRLLQVPIINGYFAVNNQAEADHVHQYYPSYTALSPTAFRTMFYPGEPIYVPEPGTMTLFGTGSWRAV